MNQLNLFDELDMTETIIPEDVISPVETNKGSKTAEFREIQRRWHKYTEAIQKTYGCPWLEARKLLIEHRDSQKPIKLLLTKQEESD